MNTKMDREVRRSFERKNIERATKKAAVVGLTTLMLTTSGLQASAATRYDYSNYRGIGYISKVEEVSEAGNGGYISTGAGDYGGVSYGIYQFSTTTGSARDYVNWCKNNDKDVYKYFKVEGNPKPSSAAFNRAWKKAYKELGTKFEKSQYNFASEYLINPAYKKVKNTYGIDLRKSRAREEYLISTAVQFGPGGICTLFKEVQNKGVKLSDDMDDSELLTIMCNHKRDTVAYHFRSSSSAVKAAARQRFIREKKELLKIAKEESNKTLDEMTTSTSTSKTSSSTQTEEFDDVIAVDDKEIESEYDKVQDELDEVKDTINDTTDKATDETTKDITVEEDTSKDNKQETQTKEEETTTEDNKEESTDKTEDKTTDDSQTTENGSALDNTLFIGDSHMKGAESTIKNNYDNSQVKATVGASAYVYLHDTKFFGEALLNSLPEDSDDIQNIVVSLGVNNITGATNKSDVLKVLDKLQAKYPGKPIRFMLVNHVGDKYTEYSVSKTNKLIDELNQAVTDYAKENDNVSVIDASKGLETDGKLTSTNDGLHVNNNKKLLNNIEKAVEKDEESKVTLDKAPEQSTDTDEFDSIVDEDETKDIEDTTTEEDKSEATDKTEDKTTDDTTKDSTVEEDSSKDNKEETTTEDNKDNTVEDKTEATDNNKSNDTTEKTEDNSKEDNKEKSTDKTVEEKQDTQEDTTTEEQPVKEEAKVEEKSTTEDNTKDVEQKQDSTKEDSSKAEEKETQSKEETPTESKQETKTEEKTVEEKQDTQEDTSTKKDKTTDDTTKDTTVEESQGTESEQTSTDNQQKIDELQSRLSNNIFGRIIMG